MCGDTPTAALAREVIARGRGLGLRVAVAESLTGGLVADALVSVAGASVVFSGAVVAYDTALKRSLLGVDQALLAARGPVDPKVACQMAHGVRQACAVPRDRGALRAADLGVATTGVAGPDPDPQTGQPAGTVWLGVSSRRGDRAVAVSLVGERQEIRDGATRAALELLLDELRELEST